MKEIKKLNDLTRTVTSDESDLYCRYLNVGLLFYGRADMCSSRFLSVSTQVTGTKKLPYGVKLVDLIACGALIPELFVQLPEQMFKAWVGYPVLGTTSDDLLCEASEAARLYEISISPFYSDGRLTEFCHPYDSSLKEEFVNEFQADIPGNIKLLTHDNGRKFYPYEAYLPYWKSYVLLEALIQCKFIDRYLRGCEGKSRFIDSVRRTESKWAQKYSSTFNRVSWYRTIMAGILKSNVKVQASYGELVEYVLQQCNSSVGDLKEDLKMLLTIYQDWSFGLNRDGITDWQRGLESLKFDVFCVFEMLCYSGEYTEALLYSEWISERDNLGWANLSDVLPVEEILFKQKFGRYVPLYLKGVPLDCGEQSWSDVYDNLAQYAGFECWIRSFCDMHDALNSKTDSKCRVNFKQPRLLDQLLVITIRTEVLLRSILAKHAEVPFDLKTVFTRLSLVIGERNEGKSEHRVAGQALASAVSAWKLTRLDGAPENIFYFTENSHLGRNWPRERRSIFNLVMSFVTARNYFAHHSYKDLELGNRLDRLPREVLIACLFIVIYVERLLNGSST
ncbi:hypothetical protein D0S45_03585 [Marinifilum sp. JC120]|nr:hypothetical protein D0S45_03585 [Marinifilum sp. JC120]